MGVTVQQGYTASSSSGGMTLLGTLTTSSGSTQSLTSIPAGYRQLYCEVDGVSGTSGGSNLTVATSSTNGAAYGSAVTISAGLSAASASFNGSVTIHNVSSTLTAAKAVHALIGESIAAVFAGTAATNTAAVVNAIRFGISSGSFDAGSIRVYGVK